MFTDTIGKCSSAQQILSGVLFPNETCNENITLSGPAINADGDLLRIIKEYASTVRSRSEKMGFERVMPTFDYFEALFELRDNIKNLCFC